MSLSITLHGVLRGISQSRYITVSLGDVLFEYQGMRADGSKVYVRQVPFMLSFSVLVTLDGVSNCFGPLYKWSLGKTCGVARAPTQSCLELEAGVEPK